MPSTSAIRSMEARSKQHSNRCNATVLKQNFSMCFPSFQYDSCILKKVRQEKVEQTLIVTPTWQTQLSYPLLLKMSMQCLLLLTPLPDLLSDPQESKHPLVQNRKLMLAGRNFKQCSQTYIPVKKTRFYGKLQIGLE